MNQRMKNRRVDGSSIIAAILWAGAPAAVARMIQRRRAPLRCSSGRPATARAFYKAEFKLSTRSEAFFAGA